MLEESKAQMAENVEMNSTNLFQHSMRLDENGLSPHHLKFHVAQLSDIFVPGRLLSHLKTDVNRLNGEISEVLDLRKQLEIARDDISTHEDVISRMMEQDETDESSEA